LGKLKETDFDFNSLQFPVQQKSKEEQISIINSSGSRNYWRWFWNAKWIAFSWSFL